MFAASVLLSVYCQVSAQTVEWKKLNAAGLEAHRQGQYSNAERHLVRAIEAAEQFGASDERLAESLRNLAAVYRAQGRLAEAAPVIERALAIWEALGPDVPGPLRRTLTIYGTER